MAQREVIDKVKAYIKLLRKNNISVYKAYLFGSYAVNKADEHSDIDVAIISPDFGKNYLKEMRLLMKLTRDIDAMITPDPYSLEAYNKAAQGDFLWQEIIQKGIVIDI